jgi:hypothetical protein
MFANLARPLQLAGFGRANRTTLGALSRGPLYAATSPQPSTVFPVRARLRDFVLSTGDEVPPHENLLGEWRASDQEEPVHGGSRAVLRNASFQGSTGRARRVAGQPASAAPSATHVSAATGSERFDIAREYGSARCGARTDRRLPESSNPPLARGLTELCPFLALWTPFRPAHGGKARHTIEACLWSVLGRRRFGPAPWDDTGQTPAAVVCFAR